MTAVVTGASGHLGANLCRALLDGGARGSGSVPRRRERVRAVDLRRGPGLGGLDVDFVAADVADPAGLRAALAGADVVYHLAARISIAGDPDGAVWRTNVAGARIAAEAALAAGARRFVHCSSLHAFDVAACRGRPVDESAPRATAAHLPVYDRSKAAGEAEVRRLADRGLDAVVVHPSGSSARSTPSPPAWGASSWPPSGAGSRR